MSNIPSLEEMLKLYTKKDLWERIQQHIKTIRQLNQQLTEQDTKILELQEESIRDNQNYCTELAKWENKWKKLKECISQEIQQQLDIDNELVQHAIEVEEWVLEKMEELEA